MRTGFNPLSRLLAVLAVALVVGGGLLYGGAVSSQVPTPTPEQLQMFQSLPQEQQDALLKQLGISGGAAGLGSLAGGSSSTGGASALLGSGSDRALERMRASPFGVDLDTDEDADVYPPVLKEDDWVIIEVDFQLPARPAAADAGTAAAGATSTLAAPPSTTPANARRARRGGEPSGPRHPAAAAAGPEQR